MTDCEICCSRLNDKKANRQVECEYCHLKCCLICTQRYLLSITRQNCMGCGMTFTNKFIQSVLPKAFINGDLNQHKQNIFMMQEQERLKLYEHLVPKYKRQQKDVFQIKKISSEIHKLEFKHKRNKRINKSKEDIQIAKLKQDKQIIIDNGFHLDDQSNITVKINKILETLGPKCPVEGCKGHTVIKKNNYQCQICESDICKKCLSKIINEEHKCDPSDVKSLEVILRDSKPCPGCGVMIFRESGCPAMFCVYCNTSFNWYSLEIEAPSHNPHYYEWLKKKEYVEESFYSQEELLLADQNDLPEYVMLAASWTNYHDELQDFAGECLRLASELKDVIPIIIYDESEIELLRVKYLVGETPKSKFIERAMILQKELDYINHQRDSITTAYELLKIELWKLILNECTLTDFAKNAFNLLDAYAKDQIDTADMFDKKYTQTRKTYGGIQITYIIMKDFQDNMKHQKEQIIKVINQNFYDRSGYSSDEYDS